ncbi:MAG: hypothetical protein JWR90_1546 [Marmoricola sp.]|jgi:glycosyltransferase involved in cell wall biosynthesis|nr:hypothetical protein [Marmoricola sp.]
MQLIIPAFNEEHRLPECLRTLRAFLLTAGESLGPVEVIVVDNASTDGTAAIARGFDSAEMPVRVIRCERRGKGAAVRTGVAATTDERIGFLDADGATDLNALLTGVQLLDEGADLAVGSRALDDSVTYVRHSRVRELGAGLYRSMTQRVAPGILDTQCGFKLMRGDVAREVFAETRCDGFSFDVEVIGRFQRRGARVAEFPVVWVDQAGSTFSPARHGCAAFGALGAIAWRLWRSRPPISAVLTPDLMDTAPSTPVVQETPLRGLRVAVVNWRDPWHSHAGGSERYAWHCSTALRDAGAHVEFLTARDAAQAKAEVQSGISIRRGGQQYSFYPWVWGQFLLRRMTGRGYDVVIDTEAGIPAFTPPLVSRRTPVLLVVHHVHRDQFGTYLPAHLAALARFLEASLMPLVYSGVRTLAVSESTRLEMVSKLGWARPVEIVHNGADVPPPNPDGRDLDRVVVLSRLTTHKRIDLVIRAVGRLRMERPNLRLDIVGKGVDEDHLRDLVDRLDLGDVVELHGFLSEEDKHRVVGGAALHVCASDIEGWGQVVIECATHGVPTLARDVPGLRDSIRNGETGWLVDTDGEGEEGILDALVNGVRAALKELEQPGSQDEFAASCQRWADQFSWDRMHRQVVAAVDQELVARRR